MQVRFLWGGRGWGEEWLFTTYNNIVAITPILVKVGYTTGRNLLCARDSWLLEIMMIMILKLF